MSEGAKPVQAVTKPPAKMPAVLTVTASDLLEMLAAGLRDFRAALPYDLAIAGVYAVGGWILILMLVGFDLLYLVYPLAAGFALIAPFVAGAFYAVSRRLERGESVTWGAIAGAVRHGLRSDLGWMAFITGFTLLIWMDIAAVLFFSFFGLSELSLQRLLSVVFTTPMGLLFLAIGNAVGAAISLVVFSFSVTSFPMLFDREVDFATAMITSVKVVLANRTAMVLWCATIAVLIGLSLLSGLVGLFVTLPLLGHASWHLYRRAVAAAPSDG
jgi:uncharacterized membrane protein